MTYQEMMEKAQSYKEFVEISQNKPRILKQKEQLIQQKQQRVFELEQMQKETSYSLMNPKRYLAKNNPVAIAEEIKRLQEEIQIEQQAIDQLEDLFAVEVVDVKKIESEIDGIMKEQQRIVNSLVPKILKAQKAYFDLLQQCMRIVDDSNRFTRSISSLVNTDYERVARRDSYRMNVPASTPLPMHTPPRIVLNEDVSMDKSIRENHIEHIFTHMGTPSHELLNRP